MSANMNDPGQKQTFLDRGTILALVLVGLVWFGWSKYVETKYPQAPAQTAEQKADAPAGAPKSAEELKAAAKEPADNAPTLSAADKKAIKPDAAKAVDKPADREITFATDRIAGTLHSHGMGLSNVQIKGFQTRENQPVIVGSGLHPLFSTTLVNSAEPLAFQVTEENGEWVGVANADGYRVEKQISAVRNGMAAGLAFRVVTKVSGDLAKFPGLRMSVSDEVKPPAGSSFLSPSTDHHDWFVRYDDTKARGIVDPAKPVDLAHKNVRAIALSSHYFSTAIADRSPLRPDFSTQPMVVNNGKSEALGFLDYTPIARNEGFTTEQIIYVGAKDVDLMRAADVELERVIDYGMFAVLAEPLLWLMRYLHGILGNWGFAIIGLTLIVRLLVMPFNIYSFKSMKVMQKLQPQIAQVRERFKDDPRRMNEEVMRLMRENKANPLGGCLPMLLQLPVFFALYQVLAASIELYRQPFIFWIHDLSIKDPYYVLPALMGVSMFVQQKITPVADPQQAKILMWMPVIFSFLMVSLPSGLTLYIFVSTLFGIIQQYLFMRDKSAPSPTKTVREAKA